MQICSQLPFILLIILQYSSFIGKVSRGSENWSYEEKCTLFETIGLMVCLASLIIASPYKKKQVNLVYKGVHKSI
jgi:hypothetical protein